MPIVLLIHSDQTENSIQSRTIEPLSFVILIDWSIDRPIAHCIERIEQLAYSLDAECNCLLFFFFAAPVHVQCAKEMAKKLKKKTELGAVHCDWLTENQSIVFGRSYTFHRVRLV